MPLLITPTDPFTTTALLPVARVYGIISEQSYSLFESRLAFKIAYFASEQAYYQRAAPLAINALPMDFAFDLAPAHTAVLEQPFQIMEAYATATIASRLDATATIENVT